MDTKLRFRTAICSGYETLLKECHGALQAWRKRREELARFAPSGKKTGDELQRLQATYAKAYNRLQQHAKSCESCRFTASLSRRSAEQPVEFFSHEEMSA